MCAMMLNNAIFTILDLQKGSYRWEQYSNTVNEKNQIFLKRILFFSRAGEMLLISWWSDFHENETMKSHIGKKGTAPAKMFKVFFSCTHSHFSVLCSNFSPLYKMKNLFQSTIMHHWVVENSNQHLKLYCVFYSDNGIFFMEEPSIME